MLPLRSVYDFRDPEAQVPEKKSANCKCVLPLLIIKRDTIEKVLLNVLLNHPGNIENIH